MALTVNGIGQDTFNMNGININNLYVDGILVWSSTSAILASPKYDMLTPLKNTNFIDDTANSVDTYDGELSFTPTSTEYPEDGTLDIGSENIKTHYKVKDKSGIYGIYDVVPGISYKIYAIHIRENQGILDNVVDIYLGDNSTPIKLSERDKPYTKPTSDWIITDTPPSVIVPSLNPCTAYIKFTDASYPVTDVPTNNIVSAGAGFMIAPSDMNVNLIDDANKTVSGLQIVSNIPSGTIDNAIGSKDLVKDCFNTATHQFTKRMIANTSSTTYWEIGVSLPPGTYTITTLSTGNVGDGTNYKTDINVDGTEVIVTPHGNDNTGTNCAEFTNITGGRTITIKHKMNSSATGYGVLSAVKIKRIVT